MRIATTMKSFCIEKYKRDIPDDTAFNFIYMLNQGISMDALIELQKQVNIDKESKNDTARRV